MEIGKCDGGMPWSEPSHRSGEAICSGDVVSGLNSPLGYWSITDTEAEEMEELEWGGREKVASDNGEGQVSAGEE